MHDIHEIIIVVVFGNLDWIISGMVVLRFVYLAKPEFPELVRFGLRVGVDAFSELVKNLLHALAHL